MVKNLLAMQETWVWPLGWEDPLEKGKATHSSILAWSQRVGHHWATFTFIFHTSIKNRIIKKSIPISSHFSFLPSPNIWKSLIYFCPYRFFFFFLIYSLVYIYLSSFHFLAIVNNAPVNICAQIFLWTYIFCFYWAYTEE